MSIREKNLITIASLFYNPIFKSKSGIYNMWLIKVTANWLSHVSPSLPYSPCWRVLSMETHLVSVLGPPWSSRTSGCSY